MRVCVARQGMFSTNRLRWLHYTDQTIRSYVVIAPAISARHDVFASLTHLLRSADDDITLSWSESAHVISPLGNSESPIRGTFELADTRSQQRDQDRGQLLPFFFVGIFVDAIPNQCASSPMTYVPTGLFPGSGCPRNAKSTGAVSFR